MNFFSDPDPQQRYFADPNLIQSRIQIHSTAVSQWFLFVWLGSNNILGDPSGPVYHLVSGSYTLQCKSRLKTPAIQAIWSILVWHVRLADEWMNWMNEWMLWTNCFCLQCKSRQKTMPFKPFEVSECGMYVWLFNKWVNELNEWMLWMDCFCLQYHNSLEKKWMK